MFEALILFGILAAIGFVFVLLPIYSVGYVIGIFFRGVIGGIRGLIDRGKDIRLP